MAENVGFKSFGAVKIEAVVGTAIAADRLVTILSSNLVLNANIRPSPGLLGIGGQYGTQAPPPTGSGTISLLDDLTLQNPILEQAFGLFVNGTPDRYDVVDQTTTALTFALERPLAVEEYAGLQINQLELLGNPADGCSVNLDCFFRAKSNVSVVNTHATLSALLTADPPGAELLFDDVVIRLADLADALAGGDAVQVLSYSLSMNRNMEQRLVNSLTPLAARENAKRTTTLTLTLPYDSTLQHEAWWRAQTNLQADITWTLGGITRTLPIPLCRITNVTGRDVPGEGANSPVLTITPLVDLSDLNTNAGFDFGQASRIEMRMTEV